MSATPYSSAALTRSVTHFLIGKAASALLTLVILLWLVRLLSLEEYGVYVTLVAGLELTLAATSLGLPWVAARYLPEFRMYASGEILAHFVWQIIARLGLFLVAGSLLLFVVMPWFLAPLNLVQYQDVARLYLLVLLAEGCGRNIREHVLGPLLQQGRAQISLTLRNLAMLLLLCLMVIQDTVHLHHVVLAEFAASMLGTILAFLGLVRYLQVHRDLPGKEGWQPRSWRERWRIARHMYFNHLITMSYSPQAFVFLIQRYIGLEATALFGFLRNLYTQVSNYLPATLLFGVIRPKLIASYMGEGGIGQLTRNANLAGKLSLFVLMPVLIFVWLVDGELLSLLSGGKFTGGGYYLGGLLLALIPFSQRQVLETVAVVNDMSHFCSWGGILGTLALPLAYGLVESGLGLWGPIIGMIVGQMIFNATLIAAMARTTTYRPDTLGFLKLIAVAVAGFAVAQQIALPTHGWSDLLIVAVLACSLYLLVSFFFKPFKADERARLNRLLKYRVFVW